MTPGGEQVSLRLEFAAAGAVEVPVDVLSWDDVVERNDRADDRSLAERRAQGDDRRVWFSRCVMRGSRAWDEV